MLHLVHGALHRAESTQVQTINQQLLTLEVGVSHMAKPK